MTEKIKSIVVYLILILLLVGCNNSQNNINEELTRFIETNYLKGVGGALKISSIEFRDKQPTQTSNGVVNFLPFSGIIEHSVDQKGYISINNNPEWQHPSSKKMPMHSWVYSQKGMFYKFEGRLAVHDGKILYNQLGQPNIQNYQFKFDKELCDLAKLKSEFKKDLRDQLPGKVYEYNYYTISFRDDGNAKVMKKYPYEPRITCYGEYEIYEDAYSIYVIIKCPETTIHLAEVFQFTWASPSFMPDGDGKGWAFKN